MLEKDAPALEQLSLDFSERLFQIKIASLIEQLITAPSNTRIVDNTTGIIGSAGERRVPMQGCNHSTVCIFSTRDNNYGLVLGILQEWGREATGGEIGGHELSRLQLDCLKSLRFPEMMFRKIQLLDGTDGNVNACNWILNNRTYIEWTTETQGPLWIKGKPGAGKSTLVEYLVEHFEAQKQTTGLVLLSFFFNAFGVQELHKSPLGLYRTLLYQLLEQAPRSLARFTEFCEDRWQVSPELKDQWHENEKKLLRWYLNAGLDMLKESPRKVIIFVDAVDEASQGSANDVVTHLHQLDNRLRQMGVKVQTCISCRHFPILPVTEKHTIIVENENHLDIANYINRQFKDAYIVHGDYHQKSGFLATLESEIKRRSHGVFLWVCLVMPEVIRRLNQAPTKTDIIFTALDEVQTRLGEIYSEILSTVIEPDNRFDAYMLLDWATRTYEPLHLHRLISQVKFSDAYTVDPEQIERELPGIEFRVGNLSGGLMEVLQDAEGRFAVFIHPSVKAFLLADGLDVFEQLLDNPHQPRPNPSNEGLPQNIEQPGDWHLESPRHVISSHGQSTESPPQGQDKTPQVRESTYPEESYSSTTQEAADQWIQQWHDHCLRLVMSKLRFWMWMTHLSIFLPKWPDQVQRVWTPEKGERKRGNKGTEGLGAEFSTLLSVIAPTADIFVAKFSTGKRVKSSEVAQALDWAMIKEVDIIALTITFSKLGLGVIQQLHDVAYQDILVFAASGGGTLNSPGPLFEEAITINSADGYGRTSIRNPPPVGYSENFAVLGEGISLRLPDGERSPPFAGSSCSTVIAAGIAATVLQFAMQQDDEEFPKSYRRVLHTRRGMKVVLRYMSSSRDSNFAYVVPWKLLSHEASNKLTVARLITILEEAS
ncbi:uncharacterized protein BP5553_06588 [Venustampulla echinocandica]|uniref:Nephrocystin 3-like N-terminal domain-containing protein n=1 Tax=Venustampulla echinocandica TaxID=2656787 RepID=A0A370TKC8_9HELO|nr:uncharacterized protein BP5553_06588 [Venustampulla echinocandica]RDL35976.1 hypothetical protein BP5553_06588 [Venustampulla echinocandica]